MFIEYTFRVNSYDLDKERVSVTFTPVDTALNLPETHIQQLGISTQIMLDYSTGALTQEQFRAEMRKRIIAADEIPQHRWNKIIDARNIAVPVEAPSMIGVEWPAVNEAESSNSDYSEVVL